MSSLKFYEMKTMKYNIHYYAYQGIVIPKHSIDEVFNKDKKMKKKELIRVLQVSYNVIRILKKDIRILIENPDSTEAYSVKARHKMNLDMERMVLYATRKPIEKPPLGVMPKKICQEKRYNDLKEAIRRYKDAGLEVPKEWIEESEHLANKLKGY
jgi:hypothetical protein